MVGREAWRFGWLAGAVMAGVVGMSAQADATPNLALAGTATASSQSYGAAALAIDGNTDGDYSDGSVFVSGIEVQPFWQVDLGGNNNLGEIVIYNRAMAEQNYLTNFTLTVSDAAGATTFQQTYDADRTGYPNPSLDIVLNPTVVGDVVRLQLNQATASQLELAEVQVFAAAVPSTAIPEPLSAALLLTGVSAAFLARRRR